MMRPSAALLASIALFTSVAAESETIAYAVGSLRDSPGVINTANVFFRIDLETGNSTPLGQVRSADGTRIYQRIGGLDFHPSTGILYAVNDVGDELLTIDPATGIATEVGTLTAGGVPIPSVAGMALSFNAAGTLYFAASSGRRLSTLNTSTAVLTDIETGGAAPNIRSLAISGTGAAYGVLAIPQTPTLLSIDLADGSSASIGTGLGVAFDTFIGLDFDSNDTLWGVEQGLGAVMSRIFVVDTSTGLATVVASMTVPGTGQLVDDLESLAIAPVPLPSGAWLLLTGLAALAARKLASAR